jgi:hypothetical protein
VYATASDARPTRRGRQSLATLLVVVGALLVLVGLPLAHAHRTIEPDRFADHATAVLEEPAIRERLTEEFTTAITREVVQLTGTSAQRTRRVVEPLTRRVVDSPQFAAVWRESVTLALRKILDPRQRRIPITVDDAAELVEQATGPLPAAIARPLRRAGAITVVTLDRSRAQAEAVDRVERLSALGVPALIAGFVAFVAALLLAGNRRRITIGIGVAVMIVGLLVVAAELLGQALVVESVESRVSSTRDVASAVWRELFNGLRTTALIGAAAGAVVALVATALRPRR